MGCKSEVKAVSVGLGPARILNSSQALGGPPPPPLNFSLRIPASHVTSSRSIYIASKFKLSSARVIQHLYLCSLKKKYYSHIALSSRAPDQRISQCTSLSRRRLEVRIRSEMPQLLICRDGFLASSAAAWEGEATRRPERSGKIWTLNPYVPP